MHFILFILGAALLCMIHVISFFYKTLSCQYKIARISVRIFMILTIIGCLSYSTYLYLYCDEIAYEKLVKSVSIEKCQDFLDDYPSSEKCNMVKLLIKEQYEKELSQAIDSIGLRRFIDKYSNNFKYEEEFKKQYLDKAIASMNALNAKKIKIQNERINKIKQNIESLQTELDSRNSRVNDLFNKIDWGTDSKAWKTASGSDLLDDYKKYIKLYPNGKYSKQAKRRIIDLEVDDVFTSGNYGQLPSMDRTGYSNSTYSTVSVRNDTQYTLTLLYSGVESKRLVIGPHSSKSVSLKSGSYRIVASVDAYNVRNFAGREELMGGSYDVSYYIQTSRY